MEVCGCPKTIDGDLKNELIEVNFGYPNPNSDLNLNPEFSSGEFWLRYGVQDLRRAHRKLDDGYCGVQEILPLHSSHGTVTLTHNPQPLPLTA